MMRKHLVEVNSDVVSYVERCHSEYQNSRDNLVFLIEKNAENPAFLDSPAFSAYERKELDKRVTYEEAKNELAARFIPDELRGHEIEWALDFRTHMITITQFCDCQVSI